MGQYAAARRHLHRPLLAAADWTTEFVQRVQLDMPAFMAADVAASSQVTYDAGVLRSERFCAAAGYQRKLTAVSVAEFIACMVAANYKLSTISVTMASLRRWSTQVWGFEGLLDMPAVQRALKVARRLAVQEQRQKLPLSADDLVSVLGVLQERGAGQFIAVRDSALFVVGWAGLLRSSELVGLDWEDVHFTETGEVMLYLPRSKTDPGAGAWVFLGSGCGGDIDLAGVLHDLFVLRLLADGVASGPVFRPFQSSSARLSKTTVGVRLKKALSSAGVQGSDLYAAHSLRRGGATHAASSGVHTRLIQVMGRWKSDAVRAYLYTRPDQLFQASDTMLCARR
jgi:integrase